MNKREAVEKRLTACERLIGYHFSEPSLLEAALTHSSLRAPDRECNERLEFLGDSVLGLVITEELYRLLPDQSEGELTRIKSAVVSRSALHTTSTRLGLATYAEFARGVGKRDSLPASVVANLVESIIGAIYLDAGYYPAREFVLRHLGDELEKELDDRGAKNYKSLLQHEVQQDISVTPTYRTLDEGGPDHEKAFTVAAIIRGREWGRAKGSTKKEAEQDAARQALEAWERRGRSRRRRRRGGDREEAPAAAEAQSTAREPQAREPQSREAGAPPRVRRRRRRGRDEDAAPVEAAPKAAPRAAEREDAPEPARDEPQRIRKRRRRPRRGEGDDRTTDDAPARPEPAHADASDDAPAPRPRRARTPARDEAPRSAARPPRTERRDDAPRPPARRTPRDDDRQPDPEPAPEKGKKPMATEPKEDDGFSVGLSLEEMNRDRKPRRRTKRSGGKPTPAPRVAVKPAEGASEPTVERRAAPPPAPVAAPEPVVEEPAKVEDTWDADGFGAGIFDDEPKAKPARPRSTAKPKASKASAAKSAPKAVAKKAATERPARKPAKKVAKKTPAKKTAKKVAAKSATKKAASKKVAAKPAKKAAASAPKKSKKKAAKGRARPKSEDGFAAGLL